ncbi:MAG: hypothetical protein QNJ54_14955 [Prochloraceae cyanobacterium]|nr:hypothetical protein [Prochloraceae cyanobacterium]
MVYLSRFWSNLNQSIQKIPTKALNAAYQSALEIEALEDRYFQGKMISPQVEGGQSVYEYYKSILDRELAKINFNLTQLRISNFLDLGKTSSKINAPEQQKTSADTEILDKLRFIETVIGKYRKQQQQEQIEQNLSPKPLDPKQLTPPETTARESSNQEPSDILHNIETSLGQNLHLRRHKLTPEYEQGVIRELRRLREQRKISIRILALLLIVPFFVQVITKNLIYRPFVNYWKVHTVQLEQIEISEEVGDKVLAEYRNFKDILDIEQLLKPENDKSEGEEELKEKTQELLLEGAYETRNGLVNILADLTAALVVVGIIYFRRRDCRIAVNFLNYSFSSLNVVTRVFIFILLSDMFVGFHSAEGWEVILNKTFEHFGVVENPSFNGVFIATIPVIIDSTCKLLIFNYFTRTSPSSVAILEKMNQ